MRLPLLLLGLAAAWLVQPPAATAQEWPSRPIRLVVTFPPGGSSDIVARVLAETLVPRLPQRIVVDNRPGAGGTIGAAHVAQQPADGHTLLLSNAAPMVTSPPIYRAATGYEPMRSFTHIAFLGLTPMVVVTHPSVPATDMAGLMAWMRAQRGGAPFGSSGVGSVGHILGSMFQARTGIELIHAPYRGSQPMQADLLGGQILLAFDTLPENVENIRAGRLRAFAISDAQRNAMVPQVPTTAEAGLPGLIAVNFLGLSAPAGLPPTIVARLNAEVAWALAQPAMLERLAQTGITPGRMTPAEFTAFVQAQIGSMGEAVRAMNLTPQ